MDNNINEAIINLKYCISNTDDVKDFIFKNINMRRHIWNDFVEEANKYMGDNNMYYNFKIIQYKAEYFKYEQSIDRYSEYCVGLSEQVMKDMLCGLKTLTTKNKKVLKGESDSKLGKLKFHNYNKYYGSFKVHCKNTITKKGNLSSRVEILGRDVIKFRVRGSKYSRPKEYIYIQLKESLYDDKYKDMYLKSYDKFLGHEYTFSDKDIKEISFIHDNGKFYIQLSVRVLYHINKEEIESRKHTKLGIDTGIHNPLVIYDGFKYTTIRMSDKVSNKIHYLERRIKRIQHYMDTKYRINKKRVELGELSTIHSNNYEKLRKKLRKIYRKIYHIRRNWAYNISKKIVINSKYIVVDRFIQPSKIDHEQLPNKVVKRYNYCNRFHGMYIFNDILYHMANKYGCIYIEAPKDTTRRCSKCGYLNKHLFLNQRIFSCSSCNYTIDRDYNASKNCYNYL